MFYIYLVLDLLGYRLTDALLLFFFASLHHPLPDAVCISSWVGLLSFLGWDLTAVPSVRADKI